MSVKEYSELKKRAILAKQRMRMGYWEAMNDEKQKAMLEAGSDFEAAKRIKEIQIAKFERDLNKNMGNTQVIKDELLYEKVCRILEKDEDVTNPIGMLVDKEVYDKLDEGNKQRYILELSKKFIQFRERYYKECASKSRATV